MAVETTIDVEIKTWIGCGPLAVNTFSIAGGRCLGLIVVVYPFALCIDVLDKRLRITVSTDGGGKIDED